MSIIHDALKKVQQGQSPQPSEKAAEKPGSGYVYASPEKPPEEQPFEQLASPKNKARSMLTLIFALAFIVGSFVFLYKQLNTYFPDLKGSLRASFYKLTRQKNPDVKPVAPELPPLAKITVLKPAPAPASATAEAASASSALASTIPPPSPAVTLNVHGVMSNGSSNVVLINDQVYQVGDEPADGVKILKISLDSITLDNNGKQEVIQVNND